MTLVEKILRKLKEWQDTYIISIWSTYSQFSDETGIDIEQIRKIMKSLKNKGVVRREAIYDDEGKLKGSGYFFTARYEKMTVEEIMEVLG